VVCVIRNIADRKRIQKDKYFLAAIVESLEDSVVTADFDAIITSWNKGAEHVYGYRAEDVIGLRNPLNTIAGYAEVLLRALDAKSVPLIREAAEAISRNAAAQAQLVNDLLDLSRLQTGKLAVERRPISLGPVDGDAVASVRAQAEEKGIKLSSDYPADPLTVNADPVRVQQIVWNLINNAVKFTPRDGRVSVRLSREADKAKLEVEDTGQGIDPEFLPHIFEMFRQANGRITRAHSGLGIGLALVKQLVDLNGGQIQAHSEGAGRGARFTMWLPLHATAPERPTAITKSNEGELSGAHILVVDDNRDTLDVLRALLEVEGAIVETAVSGADALRKAKTAQMDLVIPDIAMPGMDGYEFATFNEATPFIRKESTLNQFASGTGGDGASLSASV
jgi:two-component system CheB/CheR fusion protein